MLKFKKVVKVEEFKSLNIPHYKYIIDNKYVIYYYHSNLHISIYRVVKDNYMLLSPFESAIVFFNCCENASEIFPKLKFRT